MLENQKPSSPVLIEDLGMIYPTETSKYKSRFGLYKCACGSEFKARTSDIKNGHTNSCGCYKSKINSEINTTHGLKYHPMYNTWINITQRITNPKSPDYKYYGGRGITVCNEWRYSFKAFYSDMFGTWKKGLTIDRINNDGNYEPSNCRWATKETQVRNTRVIRSTNKSGFRGVSFNKVNKKWEAQIQVCNKKKHLGLFNTTLEAAKAYDTYVIENNLDHTTNGCIV